jgi:DNA-binding NarL/FixJ family response regulator
MVNSERPTAGSRGRCRIVLADDHELIREGIAAVIAREPELTICGLASDERTAAELIARHRPDLLLIDLSLSRRDELSLLRNLIESYPATRILALAAYTEELYADRILSAGASGYFIKSATAAELIRAIRRVAGGETYASPRLAILTQKRTRRGQIGVSSRVENGRCE